MSNLIEEIFDKITHPEKVKSVYGVDYLPFPDVAYRLAGIRAVQGKTEEALELLEKAKRRLAEDIRNNPSWWGNIEVMDDITILANDISSEDKARLDGKYTETLRSGGFVRGFLMDMKCFFGTVLPVLRSDGVVEGKTRFHQ